MKLKDTNTRIQACNKELNREKLRIHALLKEKMLEQIEIYVDELVDNCL